MSGTQVGTQVTEQFDLDHPRAETAIVNKLMEDFDLKNLWLAAETGLSESQISRIRSGQYPVTVSVFAALYRQTRSASLLEHIVAGEVKTFILSPGRDTDPADVIEAGLDLMRRRHEFHRPVGSIINRSV